jgi:hypothetical protein
MLQVLISYIKPRLFLFLEAQLSKYNMDLLSYLLKFMDSLSQKYELEEKDSTLEKNTQSISLAFS